MNRMTRTIARSTIHPLFGASRLPRYAQLAELIRQRIIRGTLLPGDRLPSIEDLRREFDVARVTVRQALELLWQDGLVSLQQGRGTYVTGTPTPNRKLKVETTLRDLAETYRTDKPQILNVVEASAIPALLPQDGSPAERYFYMRRVHYREGTPYCVISIYIDDSVFRIAPQRFRDELVIPLLVSLPEVLITRARQRLRVSTADVETAEHLRIPVNSPVAEIRRVFNGTNGRVIYVGEVTMRGDFVDLEMDLKP
jgi:GntR family transcriptional regulator